ncbi:hypothetical protein BJY24_006077 [Nocardia transvalensis]|uniref:Uncharacterized protein n=1 Tax=Nocardia transvalensis TaxID=37333 RepID=A0A7W9PJB3_9NOCA|nr:hypothetical protein [Nocardia transvalensis]MBB5917165.1 hypothetical protein [Nocardia transvalensis]
MSGARDELHELIDQLPEARLRPALQLIRGQLETWGTDKVERDLPFFASFAAEPDLGERHEEYLRSEAGR